MKFKSLFISLLLVTSAFATEKAPKGIYYGKILSIKNAMGYKYLKVDENGTELWVAIANAPVKVGEKIGYDKRTIMKNFKSKSLGKRFKEIIFASDVYLVEKRSNSPIKTLKDMLGVTPPTAKSIKKSTHVQEKPAKPFEEKDFYTIEEVFMWKNSLKDKRIKVKGKVLKVARGIMKLDWVHIEDGTGDEQKQTDDLVFTTKNMKLKEDDTVIATGKVVLDKDFGYGYFYKVIIQDSSFKIE